MLPRRARSDRRGVSLLGVLLSLCGVALIAIWAIPTFFESGSITLDNVGMLLARDVHAAMNRATVLKAEARVEFDPDGWRALGADGAPLTAAGDSHAIERRFSVDGVFDGVAIERIDCGSGNGVLIGARGTVVQGCTLVVYFQGERRTIRIQRGSGQVIVEGRDEPLLEETR
jgi:hypothetical protein